jgi:hypothetical protein
VIFRQGVTEKCSWILIKIITNIAKQTRTPQGLYGSDKFPFDGSFDKIRKWKSTVTLLVLSVE